MSLEQRLIYGAIVAVVVFFVGIALQVGGAWWVNLIYSVLMGAFAVIAVTVATRLGKR